MDTSQLEWTTVGLVSIAIVAAIGTRTEAEVIKVVTPSSTENVEGNNFATPAANPIRIQHLILASDFADLPASHRLLVSFNFRADSTQTQPVDWTHGDERIWMSTTDRSRLTNVFENNHGPDKTLVHDGPIAYPLLGTGPSSGPRDIADGRRLQTPFFYDPSQGNLLVDRLAFANNPSPRANIDNQSTQSNQALILLNSTNPNSATGTLGAPPAVLQFEFVPESGDYNRDGAIDAADYVVWRKGLGTIYTQAEYDVWRAHFGTASKGIGSGGGAALPSAEPLPAVPELTSIMLSGFVLLALIAIRSRRIAPGAPMCGSVDNSGRADVLFLK